MRKFFLVLFFSSPFCAAADFANYLKDRQAQTHYALVSNRNFTVEEDEISVKKFVGRLSSLMGPVKFNGGLKVSPNLSPRTFLPEMGGDCTDGLTYDLPPGKPEHFVFVSDLALLAPKGFEQMTNRQSLVLTKTICDDSHHETASELEGVAKNGFDEVKVLLNYTGQDSVAIPPNELVVLAKKGSRVYLIKSEGELRLPKNVACNKLFHPSKPDEERSFGAMLACYGKAVKSGPELKTLQARAAMALAILNPN